MSQKDSGTTDRYTLYERAVQNPQIQASFLAAMLTAETEVPVLGEDFSGTGAVSRAWVARHPNARAVCADRDAEPLEKLENSERITVRCCDVLEVNDKAHVIAVLNFSICQWHTRELLANYFRHARQRLHTGGVLVIDIYGGEEAFVTGHSDLDLEHGASDEEPVLYRWEQQSADPITGRVRNAMHFRNRDGTWLRNVFVYDWRLWSLPELRDALAEAGFAAVDVYDRYGDAIDECGDVYPSPVEDGGELDANYVVYLAARQSKGAGQ